MIFIPGLGTIKFGGWLVDALERANIGDGMTALGGTLADIGIPDGRFVSYRRSLKSGRFLLFVHGNAEEVRRAKWALPHTSATEIDSYSLKRARRYQYASKTHADPRLLSL